MAISTRSILEFSLLAIPLYFFILSPLIAEKFPEGLIDKLSSYISSSSNDGFSNRRNTYKSSFASEHHDHDFEHGSVLGKTGFEKVAIGGVGSNLVPHRMDSEMMEFCQEVESSEPAGAALKSRKALNVRIVSREPLVLYLENFLSGDEVEEVVATGSPHLQNSTTTSDGGKTSTIDPKIRNSTRAQLDRTPLIQCIEHRARKIQGFPSDTYIERLWLQKYKVGGHYSYHFDWSGDVRSRGVGRVSSFMVFLSGGIDEESEEVKEQGDLGEGDVVEKKKGGDEEEDGDIRAEKVEKLEGGGTHFPYLTPPTDESWCSLIECHTAPSSSSNSNKNQKQKLLRNEENQEQKREGITFLPKAGNAVYWENFRPSDGRGYEETLHAGLPVLQGVKYGLNIWSWYQPGL